MDSYEVEERKLAAANALLHFSPFVMTCIGEGIQPSQLRLHLLKEISGMPSTLRTERVARTSDVAAAGEKVGEPSSSSAEVIPRAQKQEKEKEEPEAEKGS